MPKKSPIIRSIGVYYDVPADLIQPGDGILNLTLRLVAGLLTSGQNVVIVVPPGGKEKLEKILPTFSISQPHAGLRVVAPRWRLLARISSFAHQRRFNPFRRTRGRLAAQPQVQRSLKRSLVDFILDCVQLPIAATIVLIRLARYTGLERVFLSPLHVANSQRAVDVWLVPYIGFTQSTQLIGPRIVGVWDLIYLEFPEWFDGASIDRAARITTGGALGTVSNSQYVRDYHAVKHLGVPAERAFVLPRLAMTADAHLSAEHRATGRPVADLAREQLRAYLATRFALDHAASGLDRRQYLFCSTQIRPHKNLMVLFQAMERLVRGKGLDICLVITGEITPSDQYDAFIRHHDLADRIVSVPRIPQSVIGAFFGCAELTVNPSLFEGGFTFNFWESLSVGTPVLLSRIPVFEEPLPGESREDWTFDPHDSTALAYKIEWALNQRGKLLESQSRFYETIRHVTEADMAAGFATEVTRLLLLPRLLGERR